MRSSHENNIKSVADGDGLYVKIGLCLFDICLSGCQGWWNLLLWLDSVTTVAGTAAFHMSLSGLW